MRCPSPLLLLVTLAVCFASSEACNPTIAPTGSAAVVFADASALSPGDDGGWGDDGDDAGDPVWDAAPDPGVDVVEPLSPADAGRAQEASSTLDADPEAGCTQPLGTGDLAIDELMIESVAGAGDDGEWLEIASAAACAVNLRGLHGECPVGSKVHTFDVVEDVWIPPGGTFLVADSADPAVNHYLPGLVLPWSGQPGDVLRNEGGTVTLSRGDVLVTSLTWPSMKLTVGASEELPADCPPDDADAFGVWQGATTSWFPGFLGTPNAPNTDVECP